MKCIIQLGKTHIEGGSTECEKVKPTGIDIIYNVDPKIDL